MKTSTINLCLTVLATFGRLYAEVWVGTTPELSLSTNWNPATVPASGGVAIFDASGNPLPALTTGNLTTGTFNFTDSTTYTFTINDSRTLTLDDLGIVNSGGTKTFNIMSGGGLTDIVFINSATAGDANYNLTTAVNSRILLLNNASAANANIFANQGFVNFSDSSTAASSTMNMTFNSVVNFLNTTSAENAQISISNGADVGFFDSSTASSAIITATDMGSIVQFFGGTGANAQISISNRASNRYILTADAGSAIINATDTGTEVRFANSSSASNSQINLSNNSQLNFLNTSSGGNAAVSLTTGAIMTINQNNTLGSLSSDATGLVNLTNDNLQIGSNNSNQTFAGIASGVGGSLTKVGAGIQILSGINTYTGPTTVNGGQLSLSGAIAGDLIVNSGATSNGNGTVGGTYTQNAGSFFLVDQPDFLNVTGPVIINGGEVVVADALYPTNTPFIILHSDLSRTGVYDSVSAISPYYLPFLSYDAQNVYLTIGTQFQFFALTRNERAVASALDFATDPTLIAALTSLGSAEFLEALNQLSGEQYANLILLTELANQRFVKQIFDPMRNSIINPNGQNCERWISWGSVEGGQSFLRSDSNAKGFSVAEGNVSAGVYRCFMPNLILGIAGNYEYDHVKFYQGGIGKASSGQGAIYGLAFGPLGYLFGEIGGGHSSWEVKRPLNFDGFIRTAESKPRINHLAGYGELGCNTFLGQFLIQPFFALEYGRYWQKRVSENGADAANLTLATQNFDDLESRVGAHVTSNIGIILISADASWRYRYSEVGHLDVSFSDFGPGFTILAPHQNRSFFEGALYAQMALTPALLIYAQGDGLINNRFAGYSASVGIQKIW